MIYGKEQPRIWTQPLRELTPQTSLGFDVVNFAHDVMHIDLFPWQRWLFIHALEIVGSFDDPSWRFRFRRVVVMVGRQNGKTAMSKVLAEYFLLVFGVELVLGTSLNLDKAEEVWQGVINDLEADACLADEIDKVSRTNGKKELILTGWRRYKIAAVSGSADSKGGRGDPNDLVLLDELREHRTWEAWSATTKSTNAKPYGMVWCFTNAGKPDRAVLLRSLRLRAHARLGDPDGIVAKLDHQLPQAPEGEDTDLTGWFEWSAPPDCSVFDKDAWAQSNPSLGWMVEERTIAADAAGDDELEFRTEVLCQFVETFAEPAFPGDTWERGKDEASTICEAAPVFFGLDLSADRSALSIAACGIRDDGRWHVEVVARDMGTDWALRWIGEHASVERPMELAWQKNGAPVSALGAQIKAIPGVIPHELAGGALMEGFDRFWSGVAAADPSTHQDATRIMHRPQPTLDDAARVVQLKKKGDGGRLMDRNASPGDIAPLVACVMAHAVATTPVVVEPEKPKIMPSAYNAPDYEPLVF